jgi:hypothetical protein
MSHIYFHSIQDFIFSYQLSTFKNELTNQLRYKLYLTSKHFLYICKWKRGIRTGIIRIDVATQGSLKNNTVTHHVSHTNSMKGRHVYLCSL